MMGFGFTSSAYFEKACKTAFLETDIDGDGKLDFKELYVALLKLYDSLNKKLPCHIRIPATEDMSRLMAKYDKDHSGQLDFPEFLDLCKGLIGAKNFWDSLFFKALVVVTLKVVVLPLVSKGIKDGIKALAESDSVNKVVDKVPASLLSVGLEQACRSALPLPL